MKFPTFIVAAMFSCVLAVQGWTMVTIIELKVKVAELQTEVRMKP